MKKINKYTCSLECSVINGFQEEEENAFEIRRRGSLESLLEAQSKETRKSRRKRGVGNRPRWAEGRTPRGT